MNHTPHLLEMFFCAVQLMCVLPAKSAADALPAQLANVIAIAETMEDGTAIAANNPQQQRKSRNNRFSGCTDSRPSHRSHIRHDRASAVSVEASTNSQQSRFHELAHSDSGSEEDANTNCTSNSYALLHSNHSSSEAPHKPASAETAATDSLDLHSNSSSSGGPEQQGDPISLSHVLGFELTGDSDQDLIRLAELLCTTFPSNIDSLVDLTGGGA